MLPHPSSIMLLLQCDAEVVINDKVVHKTEKFALVSGPCNTAYHKPSQTTRFWGSCPSLVTVFLNARLN